MGFAAEGKGEMDGEVERKAGEKTNRRFVCLDLKDRLSVTKMPLSPSHLSKALSFALP